MTVLSKPSDIARETLRLLITRQHAPTPENYGLVYRELSGEKNHAPNSATVETILKRLAADIPRDTPDLQRLGQALAGAHADRNWDDGHKALVDFARQQSHNVSASEWTHLLKNLTRYLHSENTGKLRVQRHGELERAIAAGGGTRMLFERVEQLVQSWIDASSVILIGTAGATAANDSGADAADAAGDPRELRELLAHILEIAVAARLMDAPRLQERARALVDQLRAPLAVSVREIHAELAKLWLEVEARDRGRDGVQNGLLQLLRLLVENMGQLVADDQWLRGQIGVVLQVISGPLDLAAIEEAQRNLRNVIKQQSLLKESLNATKDTIKQMVASFIDELGTLSTATGDYHDSIESLSQRIRQTDDVNQLNALLEEVLRETRSVQASALHSRQEVLRAREEVGKAETRIKELESQLENISDKVLRDHLTGMLNRRGLDEAFDREVAMAERSTQPLSIALLDIDNFKDLNDTLGHQVGDDALVHLAQVIKDTMRPSDSVARYGGEEFMILLPNSDTEQGTAIITRLQRELTKRFFLNDNRKLLITFSAGIATYAPGESQSAVIARADRALYQAKRAGKNRVVPA